MRSGWEWQFHQWKAQEVTGWVPGHVLVVTLTASSLALKITTVFLCAWFQVGWNTVVHSEHAGCTS